MTPGPSDPSRATPPPKAGLPSCDPAAGDEPAFCLPMQPHRPYVALVARARRSPVVRPRPRTVERMART